MLKKNIYIALICCSIHPEVFRLRDGRYVIYVIDGRYVADDINGKWEYGKFDFNTRD